jgi:hypothetical protein
MTRFFYMLKTATVNFINKYWNCITFVIGFRSSFVSNLKFTIMKTLSIIFLTLVFVSCHNQQKEDVEKAKKATIDSMQTEIVKQKAIDSMQVEMAKIKEEKQSSQKVTVVNQPATKKKGWSGTAKGAVIGAGVGAATGAIISKKKGQGAIIGGLAGAGVGAGTGAIIDGSKK